MPFGGSGLHREASTATRGFGRSRPHCRERLIRGLGLLLPARVFPRACLPSHSAMSLPQFSAVSSDRSRRTRVHRGTRRATPGFSHHRARRCSVCGTCLGGAGGLTTYAQRRVAGSDCRLHSGGSRDLGRREEPLRPSAHRRPESDRRVGRPYPANGPERRHRDTSPAQRIPRRPNRVVKPHLGGERELIWSPGQTASLTSGWPRLCFAVVWGATLVQSFLRDHVP